MTSKPGLSPDAARQWLRLRELKLQRERQALGAALQAEAAQAALLAQCEAAAAHSRARLEALKTRWSGPRSGDLARWGTQLSLHRAALDDRLERDDYALMLEQQNLQEAQAQTAQQRRALQRAEAREAAVQQSLSHWRRERAQSQERAAELEAEERPTRGAR